MASQQPLNKTPFKKIYFLSVSANNICLLCQDEVKDVTKKIRLWKTDGEKSHRCLEIQRFLNTDLTTGKDFQVICRNCDRSFQNEKFPRKIHQDQNYTNVEVSRTTT